MTEWVLLLNKFQRSSQETIYEGGGRFRLNRDSQYWCVIANGLNLHSVLGLNASCIETVSANIGCVDMV